MLSPEPSDSCDCGIQCTIKRSWMLEHGHPLAQSLSRRDRLAYWVVRLRRIVCFYCKSRCPEDLGCRNLLALFRPRASCLDQARRRSRESEGRVRWLWRSLEGKKKAMSVAIILGDSLFFFLARVRGRGPCKLQRSNSHPSMIRLIPVSVPLSLGAQVGSHRFGHVLEYQLLEPGSRSSPLKAGPLRLPLQCLHVARMSINLD